MKTILIVYATRHGSCKKVAESIRDRLSKYKVDLLELQANENVDFDKYSAIIVGGSIHGGKVQDRIKKFCSRNRDKLLKKEVGLFLCCMKQGETAIIQYQNAFPKELIEHAKVNSLVGGEFLFDKMHRFEKLIVKKFSGCNSSVSDIKQSEIEKFVYSF